MKKLLIAWLLLQPFFLTAQQQDAQKDKLQNASLQKETLLLKARLDSLQAKMDDKYYTRVPNKDLDDKLNAMVMDKVGSYITGKIAIVSTVVGLIGLLIGYLAKFFLSESTRKQIEARVNALSEKITKDNEAEHTRLQSLLKEQRAFITTKNEFLDERIKDMTSKLDGQRVMLNDELRQSAETSNKNIKDFQQNIDTRLSQSEQHLNRIEVTLQESIKAIQLAQGNYEIASAEKIESKFSETFDFLFSDIISGMLDRADEKKYNGKSMIDDFEKVLNKELKIGVDQKVKVIDTLMRCYYFTPGFGKTASGLDKKYDKMVALIKNYEDKYDLLPETYVNAAIALSNNYELFGADSVRDAALSNCDKSIEKVPDYGVAYGIKVEILAIAREKALKDPEKNKFNQQIEELLHRIDHIPSTALKGEFLERLIIDKDVPYLKTYIEQLYSDYSKELTAFRENVMTDLVKNYARTTEKEKQLYKKMLDEGIQFHPNLDGQWNAESFTESGSPVPLSANKTHFDAKASTYTFTSNGRKESGIMYYLPNLLPAAFSWIAMEGENKFKVVRGIYNYDVATGKLSLCISQPEKTRPTEFSSTPQNGFSVVSLTEVV